MYSRHGDLQPGKMPLEIALAVVSAVLLALPNELASKPFEEKN
jgi:hypothetical protein